MSKKRKIISDEVGGMLQEEVVYICPLGFSSKCFRVESKDHQFTDHHINGDSSISEYWNLIRLCKACHDEIHDTYKNNSVIQRQVRLKKRNIAQQLFGPLAINILKIAYKFGTTSAMPAMALKLLEKGYLIVESRNIFTVGSANHVTLQDYRITPKGETLVKNLLGESPTNRSLFQS